MPLKQIRIGVVYGDAFVESKERGHYGGLTYVPRTEGYRSSSPSSALAELIRGIELPPESDLEDRQKAVHFIAEWQHFVDHTLGWYEHTSDWDWWVDVETYDGIHIFSGCGGFIVRAWEDMDVSMLAEQGKMDSIVVEGFDQRVYEEDEKILARLDVPVERYGKELPDEVIHYTIPLADIKAVTVGYDT